MNEITQNNSVRLYFADQEMVATLQESESKEGQSLSLVDPAGKRLGNLDFFARSLDEMGLGMDGYQTLFIKDLVNLTHDSSHFSHSISRIGTNLMEATIALCMTRSEFNRAITFYAKQGSHFFYLSLGFQPIQKMHIHGHFEVVYHKLIRSIPLTDTERLRYESQKEAVAKERGVAPNTLSAADVCCWDAVATLNTLYQQSIEEERPVTKIFDTMAMHLPEEGWNQWKKHLCFSPRLSYKREFLDHLLCHLVGQISNKTASLILEYADDNFGKLQPLKWDIEVFTIEDFVKSLSIFGYQCRYLTNCQQLKDVRWVCCSDTHGSKIHHAFNTLIANLFKSQLGNVALLEAGALETQCMLDHQSLTGYHVDVWDISLAQFFLQDSKDALGVPSDHGDCIFPLGLLLQRLRYVIKRDFRICFNRKNCKRDSFKEIQMELKRFFKIQQPFINAFCKSFLPVQKELFEYYKKRFIPFMECEDRVLTPRELVDFIKWFNIISSKRLTIMCDVTFKRRQKNLCRTMQNYPQGGLIFAGQQHLVQSDETQMHVEPTLSSYVEKRNVPFLMLYDVAKISTVFSTSQQLLSQTIQEHVESVFKDVDYSNAKAMQKIDRGMLMNGIFPKQLQKTQALIYGMYDEKGNKILKH
ncbi:MAG: hypothetical protein H0X51_09190 [Parachlamydiaceae bacterium]|nr:hypothetical protein [Parachlamydiaceae bacterium]